MSEREEHTDERRIGMAMLVGAVIGSIYGWLFLQDVRAGIVGGIANLALLAMLYPEKTDAVLKRVDEAL